HDEIQAAILVDRVIGQKPSRPWLFVQIGVPGLVRDRHVPSGTLYCADRGSKAFRMHEISGRTHWHEPSGNSRAGFGEFGRPKTPYDLFMESEGIPIFRDIGVSKVQNLPLAPWKRTGGRGSYIQLHGTEGKWGNYVIEVPGAGALNPEKHIYEEIYFVVEGRGTTEVWLDNDSKRHVFEWQKGSLFSIPVNAWHRIVKDRKSTRLNSSHVAISYAV